VKGEEAAQSASHSAAAQRKVHLGCTALALASSQLRRSDQPNIALAPGNSP